MTNKKEEWNLRWKTYLDKQLEVGRLKYLVALEDETINFLKEMKFDDDGYLDNHEYFSITLIHKNQKYKLKGFGKLKESARISDQRTGKELFGVDETKIIGELIAGFGIIELIEEQERENRKQHKNIKSKQFKAFYIVLAGLLQFVGVALMDMKHITLSAGLFSICMGYFLFTLWQEHSYEMKRLQKRRDAF